VFEWVRLAPEAAMRAAVVALFTVLYKAATERATLAETSGDLDTLAGRAV
jgi:hypothetical protein